MIGGAYIKEMEQPQPWKAFAIQWQTPPGQTGAGTPAFGCLAATVARKPAEWRTSLQTVNAFDSLQAAARFANTAHKPSDPDRAVALSPKFRLSIPTKHKFQPLSVNSVPCALLCLFRGSCRRCWSVWLLSARKSSFDQALSQQLFVTQRSPATPQLGR
ncbi:hypothetical protein ISCGN_008172 [Ixodes scapularis]